MAILQVNFLSQTLKRTVPIQVVLPSDKVLSYDGKKTETKPCELLQLIEVGVVHIQDTQLFLTLNLEYNKISAATKYYLFCMVHLDFQLVHFPN